MGEKYVRWCGDLVVGPMLKTLKWDEFGEPEQTALERLVDPPLIKGKRGVMGGQKAYEILGASLELPQRVIFQHVRNLHEAATSSYSHDWGVQRWGNPKGGGRG